MNIKFLNNFGEKVNIYMEPEGLKYSIDEGKTILIKPLNEEDVDLDIRINKNSDGVNLVIWPEKGRYEIVE